MFYPWMHENISFCLRKEVCGVTSFKPMISCLQNYITPYTFFLRQREIFSCIHGLLFTDITMMTSYVKRGGGTRSPSLSMETKALWHCCYQKRIVLLAKYIPGQLSNLANSLSQPHMSWSLRQVGYSFIQSSAGFGRRGTHPRLISLQQGSANNWPSISS